MELNRKCLPLKDVKSLRALNAYCALMIGLKMLPAYGHLSLEDFFALVEAMSPEDKVTLLTNGARIVELDPNEVKALVCFCTDKNGIPYQEANIKTLGPSDLVEVIVTVCFEIMQNINIDLITPAEKKNSSPSQLTSAAPS
jgi:hypothetical protein